MANRAKSINVYLMDSEANGRIKATISNWIGIAYKIPRERLSFCKEIPNLAQSGVYFLFGDDCVYIGQAGIRKAGGGILVRLLEHDKKLDKDAWSEAVVFTTSNNSIGPTEMSFLENRFCNMAIKANQYVVKNVVDPTPGNITEEKESELDEFVDYAELILGVLGYKIFTMNTGLHKPPISTKLKNQVPLLPDRSTAIGLFVRTAMKNLSENGYVFSNDEIEKMCTSEWSKVNFKTNKPFMRRYIQGKTTNKDDSGNIRFWSLPFKFGDNSVVLISKEWYSRQLDLFISWYSSLV